MSVLQLMLVVRKYFVMLEVSKSPWIWQELMGVGGCIFVYRHEVCIIAEIDGAV